MEKELDLTGALAYIAPAALDYSGWLAVGMGLKEAGYPASAWEDWSRRDPARYHPGECAKKWEGFRGNEKPITAGTIVSMARSGGWRPAGSGGRGPDTGRELGWDDVIGIGGGVSRVVDRNWIEDREVAEPEDWHPARQLIQYLEVLFDADDNVGYVTHSFEKEGRHLPSKGCWDRTAGKLIQELSRCGDDVGRVLGDYNPEAGAWIRFNPLDGRGVKNENVTDFRYALVESDTLPIEKQNAIIRELELPVAALVHSGGKSLHAVVRVDAGSYEEYRKRVDYLYSVCQRNGLEIDRQNRNPSRLSRMPGVTRKGNKQFLIDTNIGKAGWNEWQEWMESVTDDLPDPEGDLAGELPELAPALIENVLRQGHKMLLAGPSKAGKSYALIELAVCIAEGLPWLGWQCAQGPVMYVNLELDRASCLHRFHDVRQAMGAPSRHSVDIWNLRGHSIPMDKLAPKLIRRCLKKNYTAVIIDPIYKVITGDENSADQMAKFCNQFDKVCTELGCAVIYCHHHSKGSQGGKRSMDRASGSGVFARDPDALLDVIELPVSEELRRQETGNAVGKACGVYLDKLNKLDQVSQDDLCSERAALRACERVLSREEYQDMLPAVNAARKAVESRTAWRIEGTLREFPRFAPVNLWFDYPIHRVDRSGVLGDIDPESETPTWQKKKTAAKPKDRKRERLDVLDDAFAACDLEGTGQVTQKAIMEYTGKAKSTVQNWVDEHPGFVRENGVIRRVQESKLDPD
ncbi:MAG: AAA family ATPase [Oscillospiraceae bacterium]|nr:AAA family ATPase [Oscillospiraceae bacterium]